MPRRQRVKHEHSPSESEISLSVDFRVERRGRAAKGAVAMVEHKWDWYQLKHMCLSEDIFKLHEAAPEV